MAKKKRSDKGSGGRFRKGQGAGPGRPKGVPNKATAEVKKLAQEWTARAIEVLATIMMNAEELPQARVAAAKELLDRGHGKSKQSVDLSMDFDPLAYLESQAR